MMKIFGRQLHHAIVTEGLSREDLYAFFPRTEVEEGADGDDIAGMAFGRGCDYFNVLSDNVCDFDASCLGKNLQNGRKFRAEDIDWCIAANVTDDIPDVMPVLVSANFNPALLLKKWDGRTDAKKVLPIGPASGASKSLLGDKGIVVVRKSGAVDFIEAAELTYRTLYRSEAFDASELKLVYLTPTGVAVPSGRKGAR